MENMVKVSQSASPAARAGAGDFSECARLSATPPARLQAIHPKKLFSTPVSKFTAKRGASGGQLARLRSCLDEYRRPPPAHTPTRPKALSMEDLTPNKRVKKDSEPTDKAESPPSVVQAAAGAARRRAAARVARFLLLAAWRRRREEVLCLRKTLDSKRSSTERLRIQVWVLKSLLDADNAKVVLAMRELERLKQLLRDKDLEKAVLEREKLALEKDVCAAEDRASELSIGWRNSRNEAEAAREAARRGEAERGRQRAAAAEARAQRDHAYARLNLLEEELSAHAALLTSAEAELAALRRAAAERDRRLRDADERLRLEQEARARSALECSAASARGSLAAAEASALRAQLAQCEAELRLVREQLAWWPRPLTKMLGAARSWFRRPMSLSEAVMWSLIPSRHGC
ncbi:uncharacterized protein [Epargyreus clarus]|uniref:uncharacterized protein isoform X1 n=1 Tax=Epargyreus clarus TaxID=520877 RepID=UPI003C2DBA58